MGRTAQPAALKLIKGQRAGRDSGGREVNPGPAFKRVPPNPPSWLSREAAAEWKRVAPGLSRLDLLKPEDRAALAAYCHGFLAGLALGGATNEPPAGELAEILADFAEISRAGADDEERANRDAADFALAELKEYVRVGVQLAFEELRGRRAVAASAGSRAAH